MSRIGILILAAGASARLGQPKQLLNYRGKLLIQQVAEVAILSGGQPVAVVLGAYAETIAPHLVNLDVHIIHNKQWSMGMASSLQCGLRKILTISPDLDAVVLMVCDQPFVSPCLIHQLIAGYQISNYPIVASEYAGILGVPALFHKTFFPELDRLRGDVGAKSIIYQHRSHCLSIAFMEGSIDLDTPQNLEVLKEMLRERELPLPVEDIAQ